MAQLASRDKADSALLACTVVSEPPCPVLRACSRSARLAAAHLTHYDVIRAVAQGMAHQIPDRYGSGCQSTSLEANTVGVLDAKLQSVLD